jgi:hypothetical protein
VWVTHAQEVAQRAKRLITMRDGLIEDDRPVGTPSSSSFIDLSPELMKQVEKEK